MIMNCPECGSRTIEQEGQEIICQNCGLVLDDKLIEPTTYVSDSTKRSAQPPQLVVAGGQEVHGKIVKSAWLYSTQQKNLQANFKTIELIGSVHHIPDKAVQEAKLIYKQATDISLNIGRENNTIAYAATYIACTMHNIPKTSLEFTIYTDINKVKLLRYVKIIAKKLHINLKPTNPIDLIPRIANRLKTNQTTITKAIEILDNLKGQKFVIGKKPETMAAVAIYLACFKTGEYRTQRAVSNATGVIEVTIRKRSKEIGNLIRIS